MDKYNYLNVAERLYNDELTALKVEKSKSFDGNPEPVNPQAADNYQERITQRARQVDLALELALTARRAANADITTDDMRQLLALIQSTTKPDGKTKPASAKPKTKTKKGK